MASRERRALWEKGIKVGDTVRTAYRGGVREGVVTAITDKPQVVFTRRRAGQAPKEVRHNPSTLEKVTSATSEDSPELAKAGGAKARSAKARAGGSGRPKRSTAGRRRKAADETSGGEESEEEEPEQEESEEEQVPASPKTPTRRRRPTVARAEAGAGGGKRRTSIRLAGKRAAAAWDEAGVGDGAGAGRKRKAVGGATGKRGKRARA